MAMNMGPQGLAALETTYGLPPGTISKVGPEAAAEIVWALQHDRLTYGASFIADKGERIDPARISLEP
jgi:hypothetical protein